MATATEVKELAVERAHTILTHLKAQPGEDTVAGHWAEQIEQALESRKRGTLKAWMSQYHDEVVDTLQVTMRLEEGNAFIDQMWTPGPRRVDAARATRVLLDGSKREYARVITLGTTRLSYVGFTPWGEDAVQILVFSR